MSRRGFNDYTEEELRELPNIVIERLLNDELSIIRNEAINRIPHIAAYHAAKLHGSAIVAGSKNLEPLGSEFKVDDTDEGPELEKSPEVYSEQDQKDILIDLCKLAEHALEYQLWNYPRESFSPRFISDVLPSLEISAKKIAVIQKHFNLPTTPTTVTDHLPCLISKPKPKAAAPPISAQTVITGIADLLGKKGFFCRVLPHEAELRYQAFRANSDHKRATTIGRRNRSTR